MKEEDVVAEDGAVEDGAVEGVVDKVVDVM